jgi:hypothetical protein
VTRDTLLRAATALGLLAAGLAFVDVRAARAEDKTFTCNPIDVADFPGKRIHVRCSPGDGAISWFALGVSNESEANRVLSIAATAFAAKKQLTIWYDASDLSGGSLGCQNADCRMIHGIRMFQ